jgi:hypothetical protein
MWHNPAMNAACLVRRFLGTRAQQVCFFYSIYVKAP